MAAARQVLVSTARRAAATTTAAAARGQTAQLLIVSRPSCGVLQARSVTTATTTATKTKIPGSRAATAACLSHQGPAAAPAFGRVARCFSTTASRAEQDQSSSGASSKIWSFEELRDLTSSSSSSSTNPQQPVIIDVREPHELQSTGRIPGAINVPIKTSPESWYVTEDEFENMHGFPRPAKDSEVIFYCKAGVRSRAAAGLARDAGFLSVGEYPGSWDDWVAKGGKVQR